MRSHIIKIIVLFLTFPFLNIFAEVPQSISYQGRLTDSSGNPIVDGTYLIKFIIYNTPVAGTELWNSGFQTIQISNGLFSLRLGGPPMPILPSTIFADTNRYLGITVDTDPELSPRSKINTIPYAYKSSVSDNSDLLDGLSSTDFANAIHTHNGIDVTSGEINDLRLSSNIPKLNQLNTFTSNNHFQGQIAVGDNAPSGNKLIYGIANDFNTSNSSHGIQLDVRNSGTGSIYGLWSHTSSITPGAGGNSYGINTSTQSDGNARYGLYSVANTLTSTLPTGTTYGIYSLATRGAEAYGLYAYAGFATTNYAGYFAGDVAITGSISKGGGSFKIDHPLEPENKFLFHSFVESPDMMNVYNGNIMLDKKGEAIVYLPDYFEALNRDFRYQLTSIGEPSPNLYIAEKITGNKFQIAGGAPNSEVSWQVTGIRQDAYANANRIQVEVEKSNSEKGLYIHPEAFGQSNEKSINYKHVKSELEKQSEKID